MGFNTTVIVLNDALDMIKNDPKFGENLYYAIIGLARGEQIDVPARSYAPDGTIRGSYGCAATAVESHHADDTAVIAVGGNCASELGRFYYTGYHGDDEGKLDILRQLAARMGYRIVKNSAKRNRR